MKKRIIIIMLIILMIVILYSFSFDLGRILTPYQTRRIWQKINTMELVQGENSWCWLKITIDKNGIIFWIYEKESEPATTNRFAVLTDKSTKPCWVYENFVIGFQWENNNFNSKLKENIQDIVKTII